MGVKHLTLSYHPPFCPILDERPAIDDKAARQQPDQGPGMTKPRLVGGR